MDTLKHIKGLLKPVLDSRSVELVDIFIFGSKNKPTLRILIDKSDGINIDECSAINKEFGEILENNFSLKENYVLEVSSPGLDRLLKAEKDFKNVLGELINLHTRELVDGKNFFNATVDSAHDEFVNLKIKNGQLIKIPYASITKARLEIKI